MEEKNLLRLFKHGHIIILHHCNDFKGKILDIHQGFDNQEVLTISLEMASGFLNKRQIRNLCCQYQFENIPTNL